MLRKPKQGHSLQIRKLKNNTEYQNEVNERNLLLREREMTYDRDGIYVSKDEYDIKVMKEKILNDSATNTMVLNMMIKSW